MRVTINGQPMTIDNNMNINDLLSSQGYDGKLVALAINGDFVAKSLYGERIISDQDDIEIVAPMQGG